jgi:hypothetical protein
MYTARRFPSPARVDVRSLTVCVVLATLLACGDSTDPAGPSDPDPPDVTAATVIPPLSTLGAAGETVQLQATALDASNNS